MRIVHVVPALFGDDGVVGGAERYVFELARHMAHEFDVTLLTFGKEAFVRQEGELKIRQLKVQWRVRGQDNNPLALSLFPFITGFDVVHFHQQHILVSSLGALFARVFGRRVFVTDLGGGGWDISQYVSTDGLFHSHLHISQYSRSVFGQDKNPLASVIYGGVDTLKFSPPSNGKKREGVVYVGRIMPHKGIRYLIEGLPSGLPLRILGRPYNDRYFHLLRGLAKGKNVCFETAATDEDIVEAYQSAQCVVLPSVYEEEGVETKVPELLGQTLLEGMACGAVGIGTRVASLPEVVEHEVSGFLVEPNSPKSLSDAISYLVDHPQRALKMGTAARDRAVQFFTWKAVVERCIELYRRAL